MPSSMSWLGEYWSRMQIEPDLWLTVQRSQRLQWLRDCRRLRSSCRQQRSVAGGGLIAGVDEAGRGPLAGPVVAAAVILPPGCIILGLNDSKRLTEGQRDYLYGAVCRRAVAVGVGFSSARYIDQHGIKPATFCAMTSAVNHLCVTPSKVLVDGKDSIPGLGHTQQSTVRGDEKFTCISAASVVAKEVRDRFMRARHRHYPQYDFISNKGYGTRKHLQALHHLGPCALHRKSFSPMKLQQLDLFRKQASSTSEQQ